MVRKKTKSHRQSLKTRHMINTKAKATRKKASKLARLNPNATQKSKKDPGIPNLWPFKEQMLRNISNKRDSMMEQAEAARKLRENAIRDRQRMIEMAQSNQQQSLVASESSTETQTNSHNRKWYYRELRNVIETADVVLEVLDARDPMGCRCLDIEDKIVGELSSRSPRPKRLVLVLNKIDLVPREVAEAWLKYLRKSYPTIAFKASTQSQKHNLSAGKGKAENATDQMVSSSGSLGANALLQLLKNYSRNLDMKTAISVGVIGYPNVGKSSIINSLKRCRAVNTGSTPGLTKTVQEVHLDGKIKLLDSPGVLFSDDDNAVLLNAVKIESVEDPIGCVVKILRSFPAQELMEIYEVAAFEDVNEFLLRVAYKKGKLKRGGVPDVDAAARLVLRDWNDGRIPFFTRAPAVEDNTPMDTVVVSEFGEQMDMENAITQDNDRVFVPVVSGGPPAMAIEENDGCGENNSNVKKYETLPGSSINETSEQTSSAPHTQVVRSVEDALNPQTNKAMQKQAKQRKKEQRRNKRKQVATSTVEEEDYDFNKEW